jgi:hypothetical protein
MHFPLKEDDEVIFHFQQETRKRGGLAAAALIEGLINEHHASPATSELSRISPHVRTVHKPLSIVKALQELDAKTHLLKRKHVHPTVSQCSTVTLLLDEFPSRLSNMQFSELRQTLNLAVVHACADSVNLITLDADDTRKSRQVCYRVYRPICSSKSTGVSHLASARAVYSDGGTITVDSPMIPVIVRLLRLGLNVALASRVNHLAWCGAEGRGEAAAAATVYHRGGCAAVWLLAQGGGESLKRRGVYGVVKAFLFDGPSAGYCRFLSEGASKNGCVGLTRRRCCLTAPTSSFVSSAERRIAGLLRFFAHAVECGAPPSLVDSFLVMGGECNYLYRCHVERGKDGLDPRVCLSEVDGRAWKDGRGVRWNHADVARLLDSAEARLRRCVRFHVRAVVLRLDGYSSARAVL